MTDTFLSDIFLSFVGKQTNYCPLDLVRPPSPNFLSQPRTKQMNSNEKFRTKYLLAEKVVMSKINGQTYCFK